MPDLLLWNNLSVWRFYILSLQFCADLDVQGQKPVSHLVKYKGIRTVSLLTVSMRVPNTPVSESGIVWSFRSLVQLGPSPKVWPVFSTAMLLGSDHSVNQIDRCYCWRRLLCVGTEPVVVVFDMSFMFVSRSVSLSGSTEPSDFGTLCLRFIMLCLAG